MDRLMDSPAVICAISFIVLCCMVLLGVALRRKTVVDDQAEKDLDVIMASTLTLLGLIIGFTFSMAITRYDQRKTYEAEEANAIGTEFARADLLSASDGNQIKSLLRQYLDQRIVFYQSPNEDRLRRMESETDILTPRLWSSVSQPAKAAPSATTALAASGMNNVLDARGYTQAAWWNRIPSAAWFLMFLIASCSCLLTGYNVRRAELQRFVLLILPFLICVSFFLIADIDSPSTGMTHVNPRNLVDLKNSMTLP